MATYCTTARGARIPEPVPSYPDDDESTVCGYCGAEPLKDGEEKCSSCRAQDEEEAS